MTDELFIGMLSGTSHDGVDAVLVSFNKGSMDILHASCRPYPTAIKQTLEQLLKTGQAPDQNLAKLLDETLGRFFARVAQDLVRDAGMEMRDIKAIGSHGQNVWHQPWGDKPVTLQLGKGELMAKNTSTTVVCDFRQADMEAGGQGAPLAPLLHRHMFRSPTEHRAILNIGGIANLTILPIDGEIAGFDSGPGNCLMDAWTRQHLHTDYDNNGNWARKGEINTQLLERLMKDPYFSLPAPKSTGLEYFNLDWLNMSLAESLAGSLEGWPAECSLEAVDVQTTLTELTARSIAGGLSAFTKPTRLLVCGGGAHNAYLMRRIAAALPDLIVETTTRHGADPDLVEGLLFAWLARERLNQHLQDTTAITGANHAVLLGDIYPR